MARTTLTPATSLRLNDLGLLLFRLMLGIVFIAHGWQKFHDFGFAGQADAFEGMGIPAPTVSAAIVIVLELVGGVLLVLGAITRVLGVLFFLDMMGAIFYGERLTISTILGTGLIVAGCLLASRRTRHVTPAVEGAS